MKGLVIAIIAGVAAWVLGVAAIEHATKIERTRREATERRLDDVCALAETASRGGADLTDRFVGEQIRKVIEPIQETCKRRD